MKIIPNRNGRVGLSPAIAAKVSKKFPRGQTRKSLPRLLAGGLLATILPTAQADKWAGNTSPGSCFRLC